MTLNKYRDLEHDLHGAWQGWIEDEMAVRYCSALISVYLLPGSLTAFEQDQLGYVYTIMLSDSLLQHPSSIDGSRNEPFSATLQ